MAGKLLLHVRSSLVQANSFEPIPKFQQGKLFIYLKIYPNLSKRQVTASTLINSIIFLVQESDFVV